VSIFREIIYKYQFLRSAIDIGRTKSLFGGVERNIFTKKDETERPGGRRFVYHKYAVCISVIS